MRAATFLSGLGLGVGAMYFLDGERGRRRRVLVRDKAVHTARVTRETSEKTWRDLRNRTSGVSATVSRRFRRHEDDPVALVDRARSVLGRFVSNPRTIAVDSEDGRLTISGPVLRSEMDAAVAAMSRLRGVREVVNRLEPRERAEDVPGYRPSGPPKTSIDIAQRTWAPATRLLAGAGGGALLTWALARRDGPSSLLGLLGAGLLTRSLANRPFATMFRRREGTISARKSLWIDAPVSQVYDYWSRFENFPRFMDHLSEVRALGGDRWLWTAKGPAGLDLSWEAEVVQRTPDRAIAWRSVEGSQIANEGVVHFEPDGSGTRIHVSMRYTPPGGPIGHAVATLFGDDPKTAMDEDLLRLKSLLEVGRTTASGQEVNPADIPQARTDLQ